MKRSEIDSLFKRLGPMVYRRALRLLGNPADAEEATQEVFQRVLRSGEGFDGRSQVSTWLYRITTNYCLNQIRNRNRRMELWEGQMPAEVDPVSRFRKPEFTILMQSLLAAADDEQARAAIYVHVDGMTHAEAAEVLGVSRRTVGNLLDRFQQWAANELERSGQWSIA